jgi:gluconolactonase
MPRFLKTTTALAAMGTGALAQKLTSTNPDLAGFAVYEQGFREILGGAASVELLYNATEPLFHEGAIYLAATDTLYVSSNRIPLGPLGQTDASTSDQTIRLSAVTNVSSAPAVTAQGAAAVTVQPLDTSSIVLPNGGILHPGSASGILMTAQGSKTEPGGIFSIPDPVGNPNASEPVVTSFMGRPFNSPNDVAVNMADGTAASGTIWFTDPSYGSSQGIRNPPQLPNQVYRHDPVANTTRVVADGFQQPNGLAFNADFSVLYITDANSSEENPTGPATIYKYDVVYNAPGTFLANKRVFAFAPAGIPDGIKVDSKGNVWSGTGSGVAVWNEAGDLIGQITVQGGASNFGFGETEQTVFVLGEKMLWRVRLNI